MVVGMINDGRVLWTDHVEAVGPTEIDLSTDEAVVRRTIDLLDWNQYPIAARSLLGYSRVQTTAKGNRFIARYPPEAYPGVTDGTGVLPYLFCTVIRIRGMQPTGFKTNPAGGNPGFANPYSYASYSRARLTLEYHTVDYEVRSDADMLGSNFLIIPAGTGGVPAQVVDVDCVDEATLRRYVVRRVVPAAQYLTIRGNSFQYVPQSGFVAHGLGKMVGHINFTLTWKNIPVTGIPCSLINETLPPGSGAVENTIGRVNKPGFANFYAGTLLFMSAEFKALRNLFGIRTYDVTYGFKFMQQGNDSDTYGGAAGVAAGNVPPGWVGNPAGAAAADLLTNINQQIGALTPARTVYAGHQHVLRPNTMRWTQATISGNDNLVLMADGQNVYDWRDFNPLFRPP